MQNEKANSITLVLGGVRSGKSAYAQWLAEQAGRVTFVATAERRDDEEMQRRIERHRAERPADWTTIEEPADLPGVLKRCRAEDTILIDCLTLYAANLLEAQPGGETAQTHHVDELCSALKQARGCVILVSNEVGSGVVPAYESGRRFRDLAGEINQRIATIADCVVLMVAGLPLALKGELPQIGSISFRRVPCVDDRVGAEAVPPACVVAR